MENYESILFQDEDFKLLVRVDRTNKTVWLTRSEIAALFSISRSNVIYHIKNYKEGIEIKVKSDVKNPDEIKQNPDEIQKRRPSKLYDLRVIEEVGKRCKSPRLQSFIDTVTPYLNETSITLLDNEDIIYDNGIIKLSVKVSPREQDVWLSQAQIASLYNTTRSNVTKHIQNIFDEGELAFSVSENFSHTEIKNTSNYGASFGLVKTISTLGPDGKNYNVDFYNIDVIFGVGFRVKSQEAIKFRRWVSSVMKQFIFKGYVLDEERTMITNENYATLINRVEKMDTRLTRIEKVISEDDNKLIAKGTQFDMRLEIIKQIESATRSIILIDSYVDLVTLKYFTHKKDRVEVNIYTTSRGNWIKQDDIDAFNKQYGGISLLINESFHDRYLIVDETTLYELGASIKDIGNKITSIHKFERKDKISEIISTLKSSVSPFE